MPKQTKNTKKPIKKVVATKAAASKQSTSSDGAYLLKLTLFALLGLVWVKVSKAGNPYSLPIPIGLMIGLFFAAQEHFQVDRKIEYAVLLAATLVGLIAPFGLYIAI